MGGRQTRRIVVAGMTGGGKSTYVRSVIRAFAGKYRQMVIVNRKSELAELCEKRFVVEEAGDPERALRKFRRVFFRVDGVDPRPFLDSLGTAIMRRRDVLLVIDEAYEFLPRGRSPKQLFRVFTGGREQGHNVVVSTQMLKSASGGIDLVVLQQASDVVLFRLQGSNDVDRATELFPELGPRIAALARPEAGPPPLPPEVAARDMIRGRAAIALRDPRDPTRRAWHELPSLAQPWAHDVRSYPSRL